MLEPLGRIGAQLTRKSVLTLKDDKVPEVKLSLLNYLRVMALKHRAYRDLAVISDLTASKVIQVRAQASAIAKELNQKREEEKMRNQLAANQ